MKRPMSLVCAITVWLVLAVASALAATQTAQSGKIRVTLSFRGTFPRYTSEHVTIRRAGTITYSAQLGSKLCRPSCGPAWTGAQKSSVHVVHLEPGAEPNVVLDLYNGGAHCCWIEQVFSFHPETMTYSKAEYNFGDPGERLVDLDRNRIDEFLTADDSFAYEFTDYAASGMPIKIVRFIDGHFLNVTRNYPKLISKDATLWWRAFEHMAPSYRDSVGVIAAWAADEDELGHSKQVSDQLARQLRAGHLNSALAPVEPGGQKFVIHLGNFLRSHGYLPVTLVAAFRVAGSAPKHPTLAPTRPARALSHFEPSGVRYRIGDVGIALLVTRT